MQRAKQPSRSRHSRSQLRQDSGVYINQPLINNKDKITMTVDTRIRRLFHIKNALFRKALCEFVCTAMLLFGGTNTSAQFVLSRGQKSNAIGVAVGWGLSLTAACQLGLRISGAHVNPSVSLFVFTNGGLTFVELIVYVIAQMLGGGVGALLSFALYYDVIVDFDQGTRQVTGPLATAQIFATYPHPALSVLGGVVDLLLATAFLVICVGAITDARNRVPISIQPLFIGLTLTLMGLAFQLNSGYGINPARDFPPRVVTYMLGYSSRVFTARNWYFWIPLVIPNFGAVLGGHLYKMLIGANLPEMPDEMLEEQDLTPTSESSRLPPSLRYTSFSDDPVSSSATRVPPRAP